MPGAGRTGTSTRSPTPHPASCGSGRSGSGRKVCGPVRGRVPAVALVLAAAAWWWSGIPVTAVAVLVTATPSPEASRLITRFRAEHSGLAEARAAVRDAADALSEGLGPHAEAAARTAGRLVAERLLPHERAEEHELYPALGPLVGSGAGMPRPNRSPPGSSGTCPAPLRYDRPSSTTCAPLSTAWRRYSPRTSSKKSRPTSRSPNLTTGEPRLHRLLGTTWKRRSLPSGDDFPGRNDFGPRSRHPRWQDTRLASPSREGDRSCRSNQRHGSPARCRSPHRTRPKPHPSTAR
ncbi:hemerythrin domain-containing protein [Amycolatopsis anabasis]|uniref:hemerythrin domain-containing protein n=1 Tax=Amycolatopsis anabasis TaxID=1840409 RepID=UPI001FE488AE|nr:hemerythrin domain-containing protein [Amycolatopsis anabasis]